MIRTIVESGHPIFDFDYPIFDPLYKEVLEQKIINRYYFREIGFETVAQFKWYLKTTLNEIMPYYNEQYLALKVFKTYDPYVNKDITVTEKRSNTQTSDGSSNSESSGTTKGTSKDVYSDTPQARLQKLDYATNMNEGSTDGTATSKDSSTSKGTLSSTDDYIQTIKGFDGMKYASEVYLGVKETIVNIDVMILDDLNDLFMNIY